MPPLAVPLATLAASAVSLCLAPFVSPVLSLGLTLCLSVTVFLQAVRLTGDHMRSDVRAGWREMREKAAQDAAADDAKPPSVVFSGNVGTVIVRQDISAEVVHIAGQPPEDEKPPA